MPWWLCSPQGSGANIASRRSDCGLVCLLHCRSCSWYRQRCPGPDQPARLWALVPARNLSSRGPGPVGLRPRAGAPSRYGTIRALGGHRERQPTPPRHGGVARQLPARQTLLVRSDAFCLLSVGLGVEGEMYILIFLVEFQGCGCIARHAMDQCPDAAATVSEFAICATGEHEETIGVDSS
jgi:hypothetical protein